ncbi:TNF receptor-associated factor [Elysia marginata]|uniref:TNF receptor-associated factor n=1 Tax=Elysia marginata TaxID=1093978 RepID=A0AAV4H1G0_9GAST|nr:TNF receptor-associated factor [Elysia marginata]
MSASRPIALCRSLSDSGFEITAQESDLAYYSPRILDRQNANVAMRDRLKFNPNALEYISSRDFGTGDILARESKACVMDHSFGVLDMVLDSLSRELEAPLTASNAGVYYNCAPSYDSLTDTKSVVEYGDMQERDQTEVKCLRDVNDVVLRPPAYSDLSDDDVRHLMESVGGLHKKLDMLQTKMNNLLQQKSDKDSNDMKLRQEPDPYLPFVASKGVGMAANQELGKRIFQRESMYVQLEQVYYNLQRVHFLHRPKNSFVKNCPPFCKPKPAAKKTSEATTQTTTDSTTEIAILRERCDRLEKENASLRKDLKKMRESSKKIPPVPAPRTKTVKTTTLESEDRFGKTSEQESMYTLVNCVVGPPTTPPKGPPLLKDILMTEVTYEWTIHDYNRQFQEQRSGWVHKTTSTPFFITHNGYRAQMEAFLDGDGCAKGSYLSVFLKILPSEMDDQLTWPAHLKLSFILVNQTDKPDEDNQSRRVIMEHNFPRPNSSGIYESGDSDCWGVLTLASHDRIRSQRFIRKDRLLLQCKVYILSGCRQSRKATP